jgi:hypothetical protein
VSASYSLLSLEWTDTLSQLIKFNILFLPSFRVQTAKTKASVQILIHLWIIMPMSTIHYDSHGNGRSRYETIQVTRTQNRRVVPWWVSTEGRLSWIIWRGHVLLSQAFHHLYDTATINNLNIKGDNYMISVWLRNDFKTETANSDILCEKWWGKLTASDSIHCCIFVLIPFNNRRPDTKSN